MPYRQRVLRAYYLFRVIAPFVFAMWLTVAMLYFTTEVTSDPLRLAILGIALESSTFLFEIPTGVVADYYSRKRSIVIGYVIWGIGFIIQGLFQSYAIVVLSQVIWGLGFTFVSGAPEAWLVDEVGQEDAEELFVRGAQIGQGSTIAGIIVATLIGTISVNLPIIIGGLGTLVLAVILAVMMPEEGFTPQQNQVGGDTRWNIFGTFTEGLREVRQRPVLRSVIWIGIIVGGSAGGFDALYTPHIVQNYEIPLFQPVIWYGILTGGVTVLTIFALEIAKRFLARNKVFPVSSLLAIFALGTVIGNLLFIWTGNFYILIVAFWISQTLRATTKPLFMAWVNRHTSSGVRATVISMYWQSNAFGNIIWTPLLGLFASLVSLRVALTSAAVLLLPVIPVYRQHRNEHKPDSVDLSGG